MGVLVSTVLFRVNFGRFGHETASVEPVRLREQHVVSRLGVIAEIVALGGEFVIICGGSVVLGGLQMRVGGWVSGHGRFLNVAGRR
jgi:hypothetical protein